MPSFIHPKSFPQKHFFSFYSFFLYWKLFEVTFHIKCILFLIQSYFPFFSDSFVASHLVNSFSLFLTRKLNYLSGTRNYHFVSTHLLQVYIFLYTWKRVHNIITSESSNVIHSHYFTLSNEFDSSWDVQKKTKNEQNCLNSDVYQFVAFLKTLVSLSPKSREWMNTERIDLSVRNGK